MQVKELGALVTNCSCLVDDVKKIFNVYWDMGAENAVLPPSWPEDYSTKINNNNPVPVNFNGQFDMNTYISVRFFRKCIGKKIDCNKPLIFRAHRLL